MALVGYVRVSSIGQSLAVQRDKLQHCDKLFQEKKSGASNKRPQLQACLKYVREDDTLVVTRLDRLARSTLHLCQIAELRRRRKKGTLIKTLTADYRLSKASVYRYLSGTEVSPSTKNA